jgi:hypothetical protein
LAILPGILASNGEAVIRFDVPVYGSGAGTLLPETESLLAGGFGLNFRTLGEIPVRRQAEISADTCWHLNVETPGLTQRFIDHYSSLGVSALSQVICTVRNNRAPSATQTDFVNVGMQTLIPGRE